MQTIVFLIQSKLGYAEGYPPSSEANLPGRIDEDGRPLGYYERNRGWWYPLLRRSSLGGVDSVAEGTQAINSAFRRHKLDVGTIPAIESIEVLPGALEPGSRKSGPSQGVNYVRNSTPIVVGYRLAKGPDGNPGTSESLGKKWTTKVTTLQNGVQGEVGTPVSYADVVQGFNVAGIHLSRGWEPMDERLESLGPQFDQAINQQIDEFIQSIGGQE